jgi:hypothetical protein
VFPAGQKLGRVAAVAGQVWVVVDAEIRIYHPDARTWEGTVTLDEPCQSLLVLPNEQLLLFCGKGAWLVEPRSGEKRRLAELPGPVTTATTATDGAIYFAHGTELYRLAL